MVRVKFSFELFNLDLWLSPRLRFAMVMISFSAGVRYRIVSFSVSNFSVQPELMLQLA